MWEEQTSSSSAPAASSKKSFDKKLLIYGAVGILIIALVAVSGYFFLQYQNAQKLLSGGNSQVQVKELIEKVGKLVVLPKSEQPTLATVTDKFKVMNQDFFKKAENGDQVIIYAKNKTAILYRPSSNKIVNYATGITVGQNTGTKEQVAGENTEASVTPAPSETASPTVAPTAIPTKPAATSTPAEELSPTVAQ